MTNEFVLSRETLTELEGYSAKIEQLRNLVDFVNHFVWQSVIEGDTESSEGVEQLACLTETLSDVMHIRDKELEAIIHKISPLSDPVQ